MAHETELKLAFPLLFYCNTTLFSRLKLRDLLSVEEVESYERLKRGEFDELENLRGPGHMLISVRIAQNISQRELAKRLGVHESQVSRDERNEYFGITLERAAKVLDALNVKLHTKVEMMPLGKEFAIA